MNEYVIIIFGASGDLSKRKLLPALYGLLTKQKITQFCIIGVAFDNIQATNILEETKPHLTTVIDQSEWNNFSNRFFYHTCDFRNLSEYHKLKQYIDTCKMKMSLTNVHTLIYFATASHFFCDITQGISESHIAAKTSTNQNPWTRLVYEKPFGHDATSAHAINTCIAHYFNEEQIYRIDHYLTKELVSNIALVRFTNAIFEPLWNNKYIDNIQIILSETDGIGNRGQYYDHFGAASDVMQNHMLQLLALIGMEPPKTLCGDAIRNERAKVLAQVKIGDIFYGQYEGYHDELFISPTSKTETFAAAYVTIDNDRWRSVPFYLKTGKCLNKKEAMIHIKFKPVTCKLAACPSDSANVLTIEISPNAGFALRLNAKKPGEPDEMIPIQMEFCHSCIFGQLNNLAYQTLLSGVIKGETSVSVRFDEIEYAWNIIDALKKIKKTVFSYKRGSAGPEQIEDFNKKHGVRWLS